MTFEELAKHRGECYWEACSACHEIGCASEMTFEQLRVMSRACHKCCPCSYCHLYASELEREFDKLQRRLSEITGSKEEQDG